MVEPMYEYEIGRKSYETLGQCVEASLENENMEVALICAVALLRLAEVENANYFGNKGGYNYNSALDLVKKVLAIIKEEGVPAWLKRYVDEAEETLRNMGLI